MSDERENPAVSGGAVHDPGAPIEEQVASEDAVKDAVGRATAGSDASASQPAPVDEAEAAAHAADANAAVPAGEAVVATDEAAAAAEQAHREEASLADTEINLETPSPSSTAAPAETVRIAEIDEMPSAAAAPAKDTPARDGEIRISADHPMAALYMQTPLPPDLKGNRGAGVLIALLGAIAFAILYAGVLAIWLAPQYPPSTFLNDGLLPVIMSWGFYAAVGAFFVGLSILVLIFGRAGWWAYVLFSLFVAVLVWGATAGFTVLQDGYTGLGALADGVKDVMFTIPVFAGAVLAREVAVWFGAWIGKRGRKIKAKNAELLAEYEAALAEVQAKQ